MEFIPSVFTQKEKGKWFVLKDDWGDITEAICSCCDAHGNNKWKFCPYCGDEKEIEEPEIEEPFWQTDRKCEYGFFADLAKLPVGTTFDVVNGAWEGKIIEKDNQKHLLCLATGQSFPITGNEDLVIDDVCLPS